MSLILCTREEADNYLMHYRTKGSKNGMRRWQNPDGSLTPEGRIHYGVGDPRKAAQQLPTDGRGAKYKNPDGTLTEEGRNKYTYPTGLPDQNRMSLVGRARFGNKYSNAFNASEKAKWTKQAQKEWEQNQRQIFDEDSAAEDAEREATKLVNKNRFVEGSDAWVKNVKFEEKLNKFDNLSPKEKQKMGDEVLRRVMEDSNLLDAAAGRDTAKDFQKPSEAEMELYRDNSRQIGDELMKYGQFLDHQVYKKSGSWNAGEYVPGSNAEKASHAMNAVSDKSYDRYNEIKKEIGYREIQPSKLAEKGGRGGSSLAGTFAYNRYSKARESEYKRLQAALKTDKLYQALEKEYAEKEDNFIGAVLKDLGFSDTPANRSIIYPYVIID